VFVMGSNRWRDLDAWPPAGVRPDTLRLIPTRNRGAIGALSRRAVRGVSRLHSDPSRPLTDPYHGAAGAHDYRALAGRGDLLTYETAPLEQPVEIIGTIVAELEVGATVPDFDLWMQLYDVAPDGTAWNLSSFGTALQRASYRNGGPEREPLSPGTAVPIRLTRMVTANRFLAGHRIRITLSTAFAPLFSRNLQTGALEFDSSRTRTGTISVRHPTSRIILPVVPLEP
jgi:putative CocE/NonD family hydrolase